MAGDIQVNLRIPPDLKQKLLEQAQFHGRSLNLEMNYRLVNSFSTPNDSYADIMQKLDEIVARHHKTKRLGAVQERLNTALFELGKVPMVRQLSPARIAYDLGYERADEVVRWFDGDLEPTFAQLKQLAGYLGCDAEWLMFDEKQPYPIKNQDMSRFDTVQSIVEFCFEPEVGFDEVQKVFFIRNDSTAGDVLIIKQFSHKHAQVYTTNIHLSHVVGATGARIQALFVLALRAICKSSEYKYRAMSYVFDIEICEQLKQGMEHPLKLMARTTFIPWMDDIWDQGMYEGQSADYYWQGYKDLCFRVQAYVNENPKLRDMYP
ncbi:Arc family DNA-binding protein [Moraxella sp.]|uniref:Arc family DNA-binding protein n=1 Tax=Moraxella sp. TaxID=479 RepID=UPI0026DBB77B|nr:Arc family DNA-binding protein [Moraxella sp.]MDO4895360.1 Arc family DNA-binding protein [Moraxella sp.]